MELVMAHLSTRQIKQLLEIDHAGKGIKDEVQALIARLTSGGVGVKTDDPREAQAKRLYDKGFGLGLSFEKYLEHIPTIPDFSNNPRSYFDRFPELVLVDARPSICKICSLLGIEFSGDNETLVDFEPRRTSDKIYWIRAQDGRKNNGQSVRTCRESFGGLEVGLTVYEGLALFVQNSKSFKGRYMDLPGSVHSDDCGLAACLGWDDGRPELCWCSDGSQSQDDGSASRLK